MTGICTTNHLDLMFTGTPVCPECRREVFLPVTEATWETTGRGWTAEPAVEWGDENPPEADGTPPLHARPIRFAFDGGDTSYTGGGLAFLGVWRQDIDEDGNPGEVKEE